MSTAQELRPLGQVVVAHQRYGSREVEYAELKDLPQNRRVFISGTVTEIDDDRNAFRPAGAYLSFSFVLVSHTGERVEVRTGGMERPDWLVDDMPIHVDGRTAGNRKHSHMVFAQKVTPVEHTVGVL